MAILTGFAAVSCSENNDESAVLVNPIVSIERPSYAVANDPVEIKVTTDVAPTTNISIPVSVVSSTAQENVHYTLSANAVIVKAGETTGSITVSRVDGSLGEDSHELTINLLKGDNYDLGLRNFVVVTLLGENGYIMTFDEPSARINSDQIFNLTVTKMNGFSTIPADDNFTIEVDAEASTAVEGTHFSVDKNVAIAANKRNGTFNVKLLKVEEGNDVVVLRIAEKAGYAYGSNPTLTITLAGPDNFSGTWAFKSWVNSFLPEMYGEDMESAPAFSADDKLVFAATGNDEYTFSPALTGGLLNYFGNEERTVKYTGMEEYLIQEQMNGYFANFSVLSIPDVNLMFSANASDKQTAKVGFRILYEGNEEILECIIDQFTPVDGEFYSMTYSWMVGMDLDDTHPADPEHTAAWCPYQLHFSRVK